MADTFPSWRYGPDGQADIFQSANDVPPGWADHPSAVSKGDLDGLKRGELEDMAAGLGIDLDALEGSGKNGSVLVDDIKAAIEAKQMGD